MKILGDSVRLAALGLIAAAMLYALTLAPDLVHIGHVESLTRSDCLLHRPWLILTYALADGVVWLSYWSIPITFLQLAYSKSAHWNVPHSIARWVFSWLAAFIFLCGLNHLFDLLLLRWNLYEAFGYLKVVLAVVSAYTALYVVRQVQSVAMVPRDLLQRKVSEMRDLVNSPAASMQEYREILSRGMAILDSISETERPGGK